MNLSGLKPCFYLFNGTFAYLGKSTDTNFHTHHALQISIGLDKPFLMETKKAYAKHQSIIIASDVSHKFDGLDAWHLILLIDPEHEKAHQIKNNVLQDPMTKLDFYPLEGHVEEIVQLMIQKASCPAVQNSLNQLLGIISGFTNKIHKTDQRIHKIFKYIERLDEKKVSMEDLTNLVNLSESRLSHIFKEQTGIPVRRYILWIRLMDALKNAILGQSLTTAALNAGFSDSAHFTRTYKSMFGVTPSTYVKKTKNSRFIQVINCSG